MKKALYTVTLILLLAVFAFSGFQVVNYFMESKAQADEFEKLQQLKDSATQATEATQPTETDPTETEPTETEETEPTEPQILPDYSELYKMNTDLAGWITIEGTEIDYPVMHTPNDPNFYLKKNFSREHSQHGCIYAREECDINDPSDNITLYGHNMMDGSMFAGLHKYTEKEKWEENSLIIFNTLYEYHTYKIFAVFKTTATVGRGFSYHRFVDAATEQEFNEYVETCKELSFYDTGITPVYGDKLIALSTCEYSDANGRLVVAAVRIS